MDNDESLNFAEFVSWYGKRQKQMYEDKKKKKKKKRPVQSKVHAPLCAARTLNVTGQSRVTLSLR